ncbi:CYTH domain-containing protein [uncultured Microscilla sp.]|uniref:CYTH domain-containing protein n=1 Tax=uncultured Microscilla sp. TaxID=432653 RepID=UPI0026382978|nr:CYTH domain-containing protein [uncultured Microscilla sp.]
MEIERKFLVNELPQNLDSYPKTRIKQWYITIKPAVRLRERDGVYTFTVKSKGHLVRQEFEMELTQEEFANLFTKVSTHAIDKTRYEISLGNGLTAELDVFLGKHKELNLVEVEFETEEAAHAFTPPAWFGEDVTQEAKYKNNNLALPL